MSREIEGLPSNLYAERSILGGVLVKGDCFGPIADLLDPSDFTTEKNQIIWAACQRLYNSGVPIDRALVYHELKRMELVQVVGGVSGLIEIDEGIPEILNIEEYCKVVRGCSIRRRAIMQCRVTAVRLMEASGDSPGILAEAQKVLSELGSDTAADFRTPGEIIGDAGGINAYFRSCRSSGFLSPWGTLNAQTAGIQPSDLAIVAADTGRGKTAFALNWALNLAQEGTPVAVLSLEMGAHQLVNRLMALVGGFNAFALRYELHAEMERRVSAAAGEIADLPLYIRDQSTCTVAGLEGSVRRLQAKHPIGMVMVDYLQLLQGSGRSDVERIGHVARGLKNSAMALNVAMLVLSQFSREHLRAVSAPPQLHDLKGNSEIEQAANLVLFLHGEGSNGTTPPEQEPMKLIVAKQRDGASRFHIPMVFHRRTGKFTEGDK